MSDLVDSQFLFDTLAGRGGAPAPRFDFTPSNPIEAGQGGFWEPLDPDAWRAAYHSRALLAADASENLAASETAPWACYTDHICPQEISGLFLPLDDGDPAAGDGEFSGAASRQWFAKLKIWRDGGLAELSFDRAVKDWGELCVSAAPSPTVGDTQRDWVRGQVDPGFSRSARRRMMKATAQLNKRYRPLFLTLTYPDTFVPDPTQWKKDLRKFQKRLDRKFKGKGGYCGIWRLELKRRKSGTNKGRIAPHIHIILYPSWARTRPGWRYSDKFLRKFRSWLSKAWFQVVGSEDPKHLSAGTNTKVIYDDKGIMAYISKYVAKVDAPGPLVDEETGEVLLDFDYPTVGRLWGKWHEDKIPKSDVDLILLTPEEALKVFRWFKKIYGWDWSWGVSRLAVMVDPDLFLAELDRLLN